jgi:hypothetical protein
MYYETGRSTGDRCCLRADRPNNRGTMTPRFLRPAGALAFVFTVVVCSTAFAALEPDAGDWTAEPTKAKGAKATVEFTVDAGTVSPSLSYEIRRCKGARKAWSEKLAPASVPVSGGKFAIRDRHRKRGARVDLRLEGTFDSEFEAHGFVRGTVKLRARRGARRVTCKLPRLAWKAELAVPYEDEGVDEEIYEEDEGYDEEYDPEGEYDPEDEEYVEDDEYYEDETDPEE